MISVIICSRAPWISSKFEKNIRNTIGEEYELVVIDNSCKQFSIAEAYNFGLKKSRGVIQVFVHDDVLFQTPNWGALITQIFKDNKNVGLIGIAGNSIKTRMPSPWWGGPGKKFNYIVQHYEGNLQVKNLNYGFNGRSLVEVAVIDGVFMAMKKDERIGFDEALSGFHNYDLDLSIKHHSFNKKVVVTTQILLEHFSGGKIDKDWYRSADLFHKRHKEKLPVDADGMPERELKMHEFTAGAVFVSGLLKMNMRREALYWWYILIKMKAYSKFHLRVLKSFLLN
jgi:glycosyltransferase involved in cell wall biosynthesis